MRFYTSFTHSGCVYPVHMHRKLSPRKKRESWSTKFLLQLHEIVRHKDVKITIKPSMGLFIQKRSSKDFNFNWVNIKQNLKIWGNVSFGKDTKQFLLGLRIGLPSSKWKNLFLNYNNEIQSRAFQGQGKKNGKDFYTSSLLLRDNSTYINLYIQKQNPK